MVCPKCCTNDMSTIEVSGSGGRMYCQRSLTHNVLAKKYLSLIYLVVFPFFCTTTLANVLGMAVVCNINGDSGHVWNDYIGLISVEGRIACQLKPLTVVEFQAVPCRKDGTSAFFMVR